MNNTKKYKCNVCGKLNHSHLSLQDITPLPNYYLQTEEMSLSLRKIDVDFIWCNDCFHISIVKQQKSYFDGVYNNEISGTGIDFAQLKDVSDLIKSKFPDRSKKIIEIGCGRGALLDLLNQSGYDGVKGYDPVIKDEFHKLVSPEYWNGGEDSAPDLVILRHTLEEIHNLYNFIEIIKGEGIKNLYIEITNISKTFNDDDLFSLYPECENLFSISSLSKLMSKFEYILDDVNSFFDGAWVGCWFRRNDIHERQVVNMMELYKLNISELNKPIILWGAGGRGSNILSFCEITKHDIEYVVDLNKVKIGKYMPPYGQKIISPDEVKVVNPKTVIVSSSKFLEEIKSYLNDDNIRVVTVDQLKLGLD